MRKGGAKSAAPADATAQIVAAIALVQEKASAGANSALVQMQHTLDESQKLIRDLTSQLGQAHQSMQQQAMLVADLQKQDLERDIAVAELQLRQRRAELDAQKQAAVWKTVQETGKVLLQSVLHNRLALPPAAPAGAADAAANGTSGPVDPLLLQLVGVLKSLSPETLERIREEAGDEQVEELVKLVVSRIEQAKAAQAATEDSSNGDHGHGRG